MGNNSSLTRKLIKNGNWRKKKIETLRFEDEDDYEYEISFEVFWRFLKIQTFQKASLYHFLLEKSALLSLVKEVYALARSQNDKTSSI